ncbi:hypothetical protein GRF29_1g1164976 [Pseudopithomyces chartarum]|uniref:Uncharacterized protein n=1 Tax=Pseudopithomyces chartarum TaxID=1892770 RepID=A0AAN6M871_9PLEO|nr:hypothetical protein GRF29_1g1164976 [Pseudopithomyces chartarum]
MAASSRGLTSSFMHQHAFRLPSTLRASLVSARLQAAQSHAPFPIRPFSSSTLRARNVSSGSYVTSDPVLRSVTQTRQPVLLYQEPIRKNYLWKVYGWATVTSGIATLEVIPGSMGGRLQLRIRGRKEPWSKDQVIETDIWNATISEKTQPIMQEIMEAERARRQKITTDLEDFSLLGKAWEIAARWVEQKWTSFFLRFKFAVLQFGIIHVEVDGVKWKIDCTGYLLEQGRAVDRILPLE